MAYMKQLQRDYQGAFDWASRAIRVFDASLQREPRRDDIKELLGFAFHARAQALTDQHRAAEYRRDWDRAIELADKDGERIPGLMASRALVIAYQGETRRAVAAIAAVPRAGPDSGVIFYNEACILARAAAAAANDVTSSPVRPSRGSSGNTPHARCLPWPRQSVWATFVMRRKSRTFGRTATLTHCAHAPTFRRYCSTWPSRPIRSHRVADGDQHGASP